jgi:hypothetical protein
MPKLAKNVSLQSIYANVPSGALKIPAREVVEVEEEDLQSPDMIFHQSRGHIIVFDVPEVAQPQPAAPPPVTAVPPPLAEAAAPTREEMRPGRRGGR